MSGIREVARSLTQRDKGRTKPAPPDWASAAPPRLRKAELYLAAAVAFSRNLIASPTVDDRLGLIVGNLDAEFLLERHDQLNRVERIRAQIVDEIRVFDDLIGVDAEMLDNNLLHALSDIAHFLFSFVRPGASSPA